MGIRAATAAVALVASVAGAATIVVPPGNGTLQAAIDAASPGDALKLVGRYDGPVVIDKALRLLGPRYVGPSMIDGQCAASAAVTIAADKVTLRDIHVIRGMFATIDIQNRDRVQLRDVYVTNDPGLGRACPSVQYGLNVVASTRVKVSTITNYDPNDSIVTQPPDPPADHQYEGATIYVRSIVPAGAVTVERAWLLENSMHGILVEDSAPGGVKVKKNILRHNDTGILLRNSDGVVVLRNSVASYGDPMEVMVGIDVDATSDQNRLLGNDVSGYPTDVSDAGTGNCWTGTTFTTGSVPTSCN
jgi:nitrous oxidase accessory protein NosD